MRHVGPPDAEPILDCPSTHDDGTTIRQPTRTEVP